MKHLILGSLLLALSLTSEAHAQIFTYTFGDVTTSSGRSSAGDSGSNLTFSSFTATSNLTANSNVSGVFAFGSSGFAWPSGATNGSDTFSGSIDTTKYYEFTVTPTVSVSSYTLTGITFDAGRTGAGPRQFVIRSSADSYASNLSATSASPLTVVATNVFQFTDNTSTNLIAGQSITLSGASFTNINSSLTFRIYAYNAESTGTFRIDNLAINGSVSAIPEPSTYAAIFGGLALVGAAWHRRRQRKAP